MKDRISGLEDKVKDLNYSDKVGDDFKKMWGCFWQVVGAGVRRVSFIPKF